MTREESAFSRANTWKGNWRFAHQKPRPSTRVGLEPTRAEHNGLAVHRLNHSATSSSRPQVLGRAILEFIPENPQATRIETLGPVRELSRDMGAWVRLPFLRVMDKNRKGSGWDAMETRICGLRSFQAFWFPPGGDRGLKSPPQPRGPGASELLTRGV